MQVAMTSASDRTGIIHAKVHSAHRVSLSFTHPARPSSYLVQHGASRRVTLNPIGITQ